MKFFSYHFYVTNSSKLYHIHMQSLSKKWDCSVLVMSQLGTFVCAMYECTKSCICCSQYALKNAVCNVGDVSLCLLSLTKDEKQRPKYNKLLVRMITYSLCVLNWPLTTLWWTDELCQSVPTDKRTSLDRKQNIWLCCICKQQWRLWVWTPVVLFALLV